MFSNLKISVRIVATVASLLMMLVVVGGLGWQGY